MVFIAFTIYTSRIGIEIKNLIIDTEQEPGKKINKESEINVYLLIWRKVKIFKINAKNIKTSNLKMKSKEIDIKINYKEMLKNIDIDIEKIELYVQVGTQNAAVTAILVGIISSLLGILIKKTKYQVMPNYSNKNLIKIQLDSIFSIYLMQYICKLILGQLGPVLFCPKSKK